MKQLLYTIVLGGGLVLPQMRTSPPIVPMASVPDVIEPQHQIGIIPGAIGVGVLVGIAGWGAVKAIDQILNIWERKMTNGPAPEVVFTFAEDEYPGE